MDAREVGLGIKTFERLPTATLHQRKQALALHFSGYVDTGNLQDRREQIDQAHQVPNLFVRDGLFQRQLEDERHVQRRVVNEEAMSLFAMLPQTLTVVANDDDQRLVVQVVFLQELDQAAYLLVVKSNFTVVGLRFVSRAVRGRRAVRMVRVK